MIDSVFEVPEMVDMIAGLLDPKDITSCLQVSSYWHSTFAPVIWRNFDDSTGMWNNDILRKSSHGRDQSWIQKVFGRYGHLIRNASLSWLGTMQASRDHCQGLISLEIHPGTRITEAKAAEIRQLLEENNRLAAEDKERNDALKQATLAKFVAAGNPAHSFHWNYHTQSAYTAQSLAGGVSPNALIDAETFVPVVSHPVVVQHSYIYIPENITGPPNGIVDPQEIATVVQLLCSNPSLQKLTFARAEHIPTHLMQDLERALGSMPNLVEAQINLTTNQLARLPDLLPRAQVLNTRPTSRTAGQVFHCNVLPKPEDLTSQNLTDRISKLKSNHPYLRSLVLEKQLTHIDQLVALLGHCLRLEKLVLSAFAFSGSDPAMEDPQLEPSAPPARTFHKVNGQVQPVPLPALDSDSPLDKRLFSEALPIVHRQLKNLEISDLKNGNMLGSLLDRFPGLERLVLLGGHSQNFCREKFLDMERYYISHLSLLPSSAPDGKQTQTYLARSLKQLRVHTNLDADQFIQDLALCPTLEKLEISRCALSVLSPPMRIVQLSSVPSPQGRFGYHFDPVVEAERDLARVEWTRALSDVVSALEVKWDQGRHQARLDRLEYFDIELRDTEVQEQQNRRLGSSGLSITAPGPNINDSFTSGLLRRMPNLVHSICPGGLRGPEPKTVDSLVRYCNKKLQTVKLENDHLWFLKRELLKPEEGFGSNDTSRILSSCPNLEQFSGLECTIHAEQIAESPWVCHGLKKLRTQVIGVPRLNQDQHSKVMDRLAGGVALPEPSAEEQAILDQYERCQKLQRTVFDQLGRMTELTHLDLGYENRYPWRFKGDNWYEKDGREYVKYDDPFPDTLELTMDAGLDRLASLTKLEMFGFESIDHRMQIRDVEWIAEHWPKLKLMYGLAEAHLYEIEPDTYITELRERLQEVRPDVIHSTLFEDNI